MPAAQTNLVIEQGATWSHGWLPQINGAAIADATWDAKAQVRDGNGNLLHEWSTVLGNAIVSALGVITLVVAPTESDDWTWFAGVYDLEISKGLITYRVAEGEVSVSPERTK